jgi:hypothetical protein
MRGFEGVLTLKVYKPNISVVEIAFDLTAFLSSETIFSPEIFSLKEAAIKEARRFLKKSGWKDSHEFSEEYSVYIVSDYKGEPEQFLKDESRRGQVASLLKSEKLTLDPLEVEHTLSAQIKYAKNDLVIVEWDGAFLFEPEEDFYFTIELFELANLQLLRYRLLNKDLDRRLRNVARLVEGASDRTKFLFRKADINQTFKDIMTIRSMSISEFQDTERRVILIGDWYSARLYELASKKLKIGEWRRIVKEKLDGLEDIYAIAAENFTLSWERRGRIVEIIAWYVLLIGWFILLILELNLKK